uniref:Exportin 1 n=1 Tax=Oncorhynchus tshawytscha TaxID=74940 RepID=A0AAZ3P275_ONCTS
MPAVMTVLADHAAQQLLDFSQKLDINLLDNVVNCLYHGVGTQQRLAQEVLTQLKEHPDAWTRVDTILEFSQSMNTKEEKGCVFLCTLKLLGFDGRPTQGLPFSFPLTLFCSALSITPASVGYR